MLVLEVASRAEYRQQYLIEAQCDTHLQQDSTLALNLSQLVCLSGQVSLSRWPQRCRLSAVGQGKYCAPVASARCSVRYRAARRWSIATTDVVTPPPPGQYQQHNNWPGIALPSLSPAVLRPISSSPLTADEPQDVKHEGVCPRGRRRYARARRWCCRRLHNRNRVDNRWRAVL